MVGGPLFVGQAQRSDQGQQFRSEPRGSAKGSAAVSASGLPGREARRWYTGASATEVGKMSTITSSCQVMTSGLVSVTSPVTAA